MSQEAISPARPSPVPDLAQVYAAECSNVWNSLRRLGVPESDLPDLTHDVFLTAFRRIADFDPSRAIRPWLFGIAVRVADLHRRTQRRHTASVQRAGLGPQPVPPSDGTALAIHNRRLVLEALEAVEFDRRAVFVMHEVHGFTAPEIAEALAIPLNTVYSRLRIARAEFLAALRALEMGGKP